MSPTNKPPLNTTLRDFADLKRALGKAAKEAAARREQERAEQARREATQRSQEADAALFKRMVGAVHGLPHTGRAHLPPPRPQPIPARRQLDEQAALRDPCRTSSMWRACWRRDETLSWRRPELGIDVVRKLRRGRLGLPEGELDLHGLRTDEARKPSSSSCARPT